MTLALGFLPRMCGTLSFLVCGYIFLLMISSPKAMPKATAPPSLPGSTDHRELRSREERDRRRDCSGVWTFEENKPSENALATFPDEVNSSACLHGFPEKIAPEFPGKSVEQIRRHLEALVHDLELIESGEIAFPEQWTVNREGKQERAPRERGFLWTKEEHESFVRGLQMYGKGKWKQISENFVFTKSRIQVAMHARSIFNRIDRLTNRKRHRSTSNDKP